MPYDRRTEQHTRENIFLYKLNLAGSTIDRKFDVLVHQAQSRLVSGERHEAKRVS